MKLLIPSAVWKTLIVVTGVLVHNISISALMWYFVDSQGQRFSGTASQQLFFASETHDFRMSPCAVRWKPAILMSQVGFLLYELYEQKEK